jgi:hypothetical protein
MPAMWRKQIQRPAAQGWDQDLLLPSKWWTIAIKLDDFEEPGGVRCIPPRHHGSLCFADRLPMTPAWMISTRWLARMFSSLWLHL